MAQNKKYFYASKDKFGFPVPGTLMSYEKPLDLSKARNKIEIKNAYPNPDSCQQEVFHPSGLRYFILLDRDGDILPGRLFSQLHPPKIGKYVEFRKILGAPCSAAFPVKTFTNQDTPSYPMGVFNINGDFIGFANNATDYVTLWNSDPVNTAVATITNTGGPTSVQFVTSTGTDPGLRGCRYWQVDVRGWAHLATGEYDRILYDTTLIVANTYNIFGARFWGGYSHYGLAQTLQRAITFAPPGYPVTVGDLDRTSPNGLNATGARQINFNVGATQKTVTVFHNENSQCAGFLSNLNSAVGSGAFDGLPNDNQYDSETMNLRGTWPPGLLSIFIFCNGNVRENISPTNITNYSDLTKVAHADFGSNDVTGRVYTPVGPWNNDEYDVGGLFLSALPNKAALLAVSINNYRILSAGSSLDGSGISLGDFPNLKAIKFTYKSKPFTPNAATFPLIDQYFSLIFGNSTGGEGWTAGEIDDIYNMLGTRLATVVPIGPLKRLDVQWFNTSATAASLAARTVLSTNGWLVN